MPSPSFSGERFRGRISLVAAFISLGVAFLRPGDRIFSGRNVCSQATDRLSMRSTDLLFYIRDRVKIEGL